MIKFYGFKEAALEVVSKNPGCWVDWVLNETQEFGNDKSVESAKIRLIEELVSEGKLIMISFLHQGSFLDRILFPVTGSAFNIFFKNSFSVNSCIVGRGEVTIIKI